MVRQKKNMLYMKMSATRSSLPIGCCNLTTRVCISVVVAAIKHKTPAYGIKIDQPRAVTMVVGVVCTSFRKYAHEHSAAQ